MQAWKMCSSNRVQEVATEMENIQAGCRFFMNPSKIKPNHIRKTGWNLWCTKVGIVYRFSDVTVISLNTWNSKTNVFI